MLGPCGALVGALGLLGACGGSSADPPGATCTDPARGPAMARFADVTRASGIEFTYASFGFKGGGLAVADLDGDDLPDVIAGRRDGGLAVFRNRGGLRGLRFEAIGDAGIDPAVAATAIAVADLDNDGDRDLVIASSGSALVMAGAGDGRFREVARFADSGMTEHVLPVDLDGDGLLDLYFSNYDLRSLASTANRLYVNRGNLQFLAGVTAGPGLSWTATALDIDDDGDQDLYVANDTLLADFGTGGPDPVAPWPVDLLLRNDGPGADGVPQLTDIAAERGLARPRSSMGGLVADFDDDGRLDLFVTDYGANKLFVRDAGGSYVDRAAALGVAATMRVNADCGPDTRSEDCLLLSWGAALGDFDLDGHDELVVVNGDTGNGRMPPVVVHTRGAELGYHELTPEIPCMDARNLVVTDLDGDGDQDVVIGHQDGPLEIYENGGRPASGTWQRVVLRGGSSNRDGIGAVVTLRLASGRTVMRVVGAGGVVHTASPAEAVFGLGRERVAAIAVRWPSGRLTEVTAPPAGTIVLDEGP